jgi:hypothetical protein
MDKNNINHANILGSSFGGYWAQFFALRHAMREQLFVGNIFVDPKPLFANPLFAPEFVRSSSAAKELLKIIASEQDACSVSRNRGGDSCGLACRNSRGRNGSGGAVRVCKSARSSGRVLRPRDQSNGPHRRRLRKRGIGRRRAIAASRFADGRSVARSERIPKRLQSVKSGYGDTRYWPFASFAAPRGHV